MYRLFLVVAAALSTSLPATAEPLQTYKVKAKIEAGMLRGVPCALQAGGKTLQFLTPGSVDLPQDKTGMAIFDSLSCRMNEVTLTTTTSGDPRSVVIVFDFAPPTGLIGPIYFLKSNGGVSAFFNNRGKLLKVQ